jgi:hypothetical protein
MAAALVLAVAPGCSDRITYVQQPAAPTPVAVPVPDRIEYRVLGTFDRVTVRHSNQQDGTTQVITGLPYVTSFTTLQPSLFISLDVAAQGDGYLQLQLMVNGFVVREANSTTENPRVSLNYTYRRVTP